MKAVLIAFTIAVLALAEYAYVELAPFPPEKRVQKLVKLPVLGSTIERMRASHIREQIAKGVNEGNPIAFSQWYHQAKEAADTSTMQRAVDLLRSSDSYTAAYLLRHIEHGFPTQDEWRTIDVRLPYYGMAMENYRVPGSSDHAHAEQTKTNETTIRQLRSAATKGDYVSQQILVELDK